MRGKNRQERNALADQLGIILRERFQVAAGERVGVGVSGGADSVALLRLMVEAREKLGIVVCAAHFNHQLRGRASDADEKFAEKLAARHGLEFFVERENVAALAKRERRNVEDAGRRARYAWFERLVKQGRVGRVAVAHTADDQAETVLAHILRGTGIAGLGGIHPEAGCVFRPLLGVRRAELRMYLRGKRQAWREDATNQDVTRTRARLRRQLLPALEKKFNPGVVEHLCQLAELAREDEAWLDEEAERHLQKILRTRADGIAVPVNELDRRTEGREENAPTGGRAFPGAGHRTAIAKRMVRQVVRRVKPQAGELGSRHVDAVLQLSAHGHSGKILQLPGGVEVRRERDMMVFCAAAPGNREPSQKTPRASNRKGSKGDALAAGLALTQEVRLPPTGQTLRLAAPSRILHLRVIDWPPEGRETTGWGAAMDRERLGVPLVLRYWRAGDAMRPVGHQKRHTLARLLNELGKTRWEKQTWPVLESAGKVAWALGLPAAEEFAIAKGSRIGVVITEESAR